MNEEKSIVQSPPPKDRVVEGRMSIDSARTFVRDGDLVVRTGNDMVSEILAEMGSREKLYSHCGMAFIDSGNIFVYHNMAGDFNPDEKMRRDPLDSFLNPVYNDGFGIYRYDLDSVEIEQSRNIIMKHYRDRMQFDMKFDLQTNDKMYCAELIAKTVQQATQGRIVMGTMKVEQKFIDKYIKRIMERKLFQSKKDAYNLVYIPIDHLYLNPHCKEIRRVAYQRPVISF